MGAIAVLLALSIAATLSEISETENQLYSYFNQSDRTQRSARVISRLGRGNETQQSLLVL
jgi:hypothetical protein